jgi:hypothetical protein
MHYGPASSMSDLDNNVCLLHYIKYAEQLMRGVDLETQPESFLKFTRDASEWLKKKLCLLEGEEHRRQFSGTSPRGSVAVTGKALDGFRQTCTQEKAC